MLIRDYWNLRASSDAENATTSDLFLRVLERKILADELRCLGCGPQSEVLDLGCGDGQTLEYLARELGCACLGIDISQAMIQLARGRITKLESPVKVEFRIGDVRQATELLVDRKFDYVITDRCLINLESSEEQFKSIQGIADLLRNGGYYLAIENFIEGNDRLNQIRELFELPPIPIRWHNLYFRELDFLAEAARFFTEIRRVDFSSAYYLATRVIYSKLCQLQGLEPDYVHPIHQLSVTLPLMGDFSPIKLFVMRKGQE